LVLLADSPRFEEIAKWQTQLTHAHPVCAPADYVFLKSLEAAVRGFSKEEVFSMAVELSREKLPQFAPYLESVPSIPWAQLKTSGYVLDTLQAAFWGLMNTSSLEEAVTSVVNRGDDADTCGAVTGALCGAYYGLGGIPAARWLSVLRRRNYLLLLLGSY
jgi:ADP-ribosyl-[dinitrogen reductase] hydrolase